MANFKVGDMVKSTVIGEENYPIIMIYEINYEIENGIPQEHVCCLFPFDSDRPATSFFTNCIRHATEIEIAQERRANSW